MLPRYRFFTRELSTAAHRLEEQPNCVLIEDLQERSEHVWHPMTAASWSFHSKPLAAVHYAHNSTLYCSMGPRN